MSDWQEIEKREKVERKVEIIDTDGPVYARIMNVKVSSLETRTKLLEDQIPRIITLIADLNNLTRAIEEIKADIKEIKKQTKP